MHWPTGPINENQYQFSLHHDNNSAAIGGYIARAGNANRDTSSAVKMSLSILDLLPVLSGTADEQLSWFQQKGLLSRSQNCPSCGLEMRIQARNDIQDKRRYIYSVLYDNIPVTDIPCRHTHTHTHKSLINYSTSGGDVQMMPARRVAVSDLVASLRGRSFLCSSGSSSFTGGLGNTQ